MRASSHYRRDNGGIKSRPYFNAIARVVRRDEDSDGEEVYGADDQNFKVYRTHYNAIESEEIISKYCIFA